MRVVAPNPNQPRLTETQLHFQQMDLKSEFQHSFLVQDLILLQWQACGSNNADSSSGEELE
jgi:hypothetical protein